MKKGKKVIAVMLVAVMALSLAACSGGSSTTSATEAPATEAATEAAAAEEAEEADTEETEAAEAEGTWVPEKGITLVVPYEAGGNSDVPTRVFVKYMNDHMDDGEISVTNIEGASGRTGALEVMDSDPDGYTLLMSSQGYAMNYALGNATFSYEDFEPVGLMFYSSLALVVNADSDYQTLDDLIEAAKADPGKVMLGASSGTVPQFAALYLEDENDVQFNIVDLDTASKAPELLSNRIDGYIDGFSNIKQYLDSGDFRCLALFAGLDIAGYDDIDTLEELGYSDFGYIKQAFGIWAPKGTPKEAIDYINSIMKAAYEDPECVEELGITGIEATYFTPEEYTDYLQEVYATYEGVVASWEN